MKHKSILFYHTSENILIVFNETIGENNLFEWQVTHIILISNKLYQINYIKICQIIKNSLIFLIYFAYNNNYIFIKKNTSI